MLLQQRGGRTWEENEEVLLWTPTPFNIQEVPTEDENADSAPCTPFPLHQGDFMLADLVEVDECWDLIKFLTITGPCWKNTSPQPPTRKMAGARERRLEALDAEMVRLTIKEEKWGQRRRRSFIDDKVCFCKRWLSTFGHFMFCVKPETQGILFKSQGLVKLHLCLVCCSKFVFLAKSGT